MKIRIRDKLLGGLTIVLILITITIIISMTSIRSLYKNVLLTNEHPLVVIRASAKIAVMVTTMHRSMKDVVLSHNLAERKKYITVVDEYEEEALRQFDIVQKQILGEKGLAMTSDAREMFINWRPIRQRVINLMANGQYEQAQTITRTEGEEYVELLISEMETMTEYAINKAAGFNKDAANIAAHAQTNIIIVLIISGLVGISLSLYFSFTITSRLSTISSTTAQMAAGELKQNIKIRGHDELYEVAENFNTMAKQLAASYEKLENRVKERTQELLKSNTEFKRLQSELELKVEERTKEFEEKVQKLNKSQKAMLYMVEDLNMTSKELKVAQRELVTKEKLATLGRLAGGVSHELRNPLGALKNASFFLKMVIEKPEPQVKETLDIIEREIDTSERIISSLLDFARPRPPASTKANINNVIKKVLTRITTPENVKVVDQLNRNLPSVMTDADQMSHVFGNIITNAYQAMQNGGQLILRSVKADDYVVISISDTGEGIPKDRLEEIFEPLFTTKAKGIGLGLALVKTLVEGHGGTIEVESVVGKGSTFIVSLPFTNGEASKYK